MHGAPSGAQLVLALRPLFGRETFSNQTDGTGRGPCLTSSSSSRWTSRNPGANRTAAVAHFSKAAKMSTHE